MILNEKQNLPHHHNSSETQLVEKWQQKKKKKKNDKLISQTSKYMTAQSPNLVQAH